MQIKLPVLVSCFYLMICFSMSLKAQENIALNKDVEASGTTKRSWPGFIVDGDYSSYSYAIDNTDGIPGFHFDVDLEQEYNLDKIIIFNNTSDPERLSNYRVDIYSDNFGVYGDIIWSTLIRSDGSNSGIGGSDIISADLHPEGKFCGRYIRVTNLSDVALAPFINEIEVYEAPLPLIHSFETSTGNITKTGDSTLQELAELSWIVSGADSIIIHPEIGVLSLFSGGINVSPNERTTYTLTAFNSFGTLSKNITIAVDELVKDPMISEFMASNNATIEDELGDAHDWIELYNPNNFNLNIQGFFLTDEPSNLSKWQFPSRSIPPNGFLTLFASGKDQISPETPLHTNFDLDADGDPLALIAKDGRTVLQQFSHRDSTGKDFPKQRADVSYGVDTLGNVGYFNTPTPNEVNAKILNDYVREVKFTPNRGVYNAPITLNITTSSLNAVIRYTTDGTEPNENHGLIYTAPLNISNTTVVKACAVDSMSVPSRVKNHSYIFIDDVVNSDVMDKAITGNSAYKSQIVSSFNEIPSVSIVTQANINTTTEVKTSVEWIDPMNKEDLQVFAGAKIYGGSFTAFDKRNFRLYFRGVYGDKKLTHPVFKSFDHSIPAVEEFDRIELRAGGHDMQTGFYMSNRFTDDIMLESGSLNPHGRYVHLFLNGVYWGQYHLRERWNHHMFASYFGGEKDDYEAMNGNVNLGGWTAFDVPYAGDGSTWKYMMENRDSYETIKDLLDIPELIKFMTLYMYGAGETEYRAVGSKLPNVGYKFYFNDADRFTRGSGDRTAMGQPGRKNGDGPGSFYSTLLKEAHPDYMVLLADELHKFMFNDGVLTPTRLTAILNERCDEVKNSIVAECARWGYRTPANWITAKDNYINTVIPTRTSVLLSQLKAAGIYPSIDAPIFSQAGGVVDDGFKLTLSSNVETIYYTSDGSDPRLPGGELSASAEVYSSSAKSYIALVDENTLPKALVPTDGTLGTSWTAIDFDDNGWLSTSSGAGVGYDEADTYTSHIDLSTMGEMNDKNASVFIRYEFEVDDVSNLESLELKMKVDDGFVAYLNGVSIASFNAPANPSWNSTASTSNSDDQAVVFSPVTMNHEDVKSLLKKGSNVLAIQGLNLKLSSTDFLIEPEFIALYQEDASDIESITINDSVMISARAYNVDSWSALSYAHFEIEEAETILHEASVIRMEEISLNKIYPNPFNDETTIRFMVNKGTIASLEVHDVTGKRIWEDTYSVEEGILNTEIIATSSWDSGMFFYRLTTPSGALLTGKMIHIK